MMSIMVGANSNPASRAAISALRDPLQPGRVLGMAEFFYFFAVTH
jgi:hypothetical protein